MGDEHRTDRVGTQRKGPVKKEGPGLSNQRIKRGQSRGPHNRLKRNSKAGPRRRGKKVDTLIGRAKLVNPACSDQGDFRRPTREIQNFFG